MARLEKETTDYVMLTIRIDRGEIPPSLEQIQEAHDNGYALLSASGTDPLKWYVFRKCNANSEWLRQNWLK